jgi:hypothetical protein
LEIDKRGTGKVREWHYKREKNQEREREREYYY